ncbi:alpha-hydroxy acid oxidase [Ramlibacter rhizophilus]|uniref:Alpha-hydroxy-acid oxidizing protein n=1 Tax=Ramlibacter rhizophilus TaxID=1781167 RepID=A0A4Z0BS76_9BURK|nr:alpha-hydroxy acid oxidase [Ramlibacter rhizophilus]TFZ01280.1 alpha-hydroxy-acid oxidizing protein [Ramlibacter rhizophilus]
MHAAARCDRAWSIDELRRLARARLPRPVFDFYDGGAEDEETLRAEREAFARTALVPRRLVDVRQVRTDGMLLGAPASLPLAVAPMGAVAYGWPDGDIAIARAAAAAGIPYTLSTMAAASLERVADEAPGRLWFQAHLLWPRERTLALVERARVAGYEALVVTADLPVGGKRERDLRHALAMPFRLRPRHLPAFAARPGWCLDLLRHGLPQMPNMQAGTGASSIGAGFDAGFDGAALRALREAWPRRLVVKGLLHPQDAALAVKAGADAIVVSTHGGRQLDGCMTALDALPTVVQAVAGRAEVLLDGGVRRGRDVLKALACGADGVMLGRAILWGACAGGEAGAARAITLIAQELVRTMQLCGITSLQDHGRLRDLCLSPAAPASAAD